jgi:D-sedoheptulose 7-phosphate isomerase
MMSPTTTSSAAVNAPELNTPSIAQAYLARFSALIDCIDLGALQRVVEHLRRARDTRATIFMAGNGGSAATASHWVNDLGKATKRSGRNPFRVMCLSDNGSWLTALGNDEGYESVFAGQLDNFAEAGDVLMVISASGNSPNLLRAVELANSRQLVTVALLGFDGGALLSMVTEALWLPSQKGEYGLVETGHSLVADIVTSCLIADRPEGTTAPSAVATLAAT